MSNVAFYQAINVDWAHGDGVGGRRDFASHHGCYGSCLRLMSKSTQNAEPLLRKGYCRAIKSKKLVSCASNSCSSAPYPFLASSLSGTNDSVKKENVSVLILIRHGESMWNEKNLFTGCVDVPLTEKGVEEAIEAGCIVRLECKKRDNTDQVTYSKEAVTDSNGEYQMRVERDAGDEICEVFLVKSSDPTCSTPNAGRDRARICLTRNNGMVSNEHYANNMGYLLNVPLASCPKILQQYQDADSV